MSSVNEILGVDGGGTRTRASIVLDGRVLAHSVNGSIKRLRVGAEAAEQNLRALLKDVYAQAGVTAVGAASVGVASAHAGNNGVDRCRSHGVRRGAVRGSG